MLNLTRSLKFTKVKPGHSCEARPKLQVSVLPSSRCIRNLGFLAIKQSSPSTSDCYRGVSTRCMLCSSPIKSGPSHSSPHNSRCSADPRFTQCRVPRVEIAAGPRSTSDVQTCVPVLCVCLSNAMSIYDRTRGLGRDCRSFLRVSNRLPHHGYLGIILPLHLRCCLHGGIFSAALQSSVVQTCTQEESGEV